MDFGNEIVIAFQQSVPETDRTRQASEPVNLPTPECRRWFDHRTQMASLFFLLFLLSLFPATAKAQFLGYVAPQTNQQTLATNVTCTGSQQNFVVANFGQISHIALIPGLPGGVQNFSVAIQGSTDGTNFQNISDIGTTGGGSPPLIVNAQNYYAVVRVGVVCSGGNFNLSYTGIAGGVGGQTAGSGVVTQVDKFLANAAPAGSNFAAPLAPGQPTSPFGNSAGQLVFSYSGTGPANSNLRIICQSNGTPGTSIASPNVYGPFTLQTTANLVQTFPIPAGPCPNYLVSYTSGGASAANYNLEYLFAQPGLTAPATLFNHITGTTATAVKPVPGYLHTINVNTGGAGTVSVFDLATASCTGTPATNTVAVVTATATTLQTFTFDVNLLNGICVKASVAMDLTVSYQ